MPPKIATIEAIVTGTGVVEAVIETEYVATVIAVSGAINWEAAEITTLRVTAVRLTTDGLAVDDTVRLGA